jgi:hypothetical protein
MAIVTADGWFGAARQQALIRKTAGVVSIAATAFSVWDVAGNPGAGTLAVGNTTTGVVPTDATAGAPLINAFGGGATGYLAAAQYRNSVASGCVLYDRLWHAGAVSMTALATTTFSSQPSYAGRLPNGTDYGNLEILLEINTAVSATATNVSVAYTKEDGTTGRTTGASASLSGFTNKRIVMLPLQAGDKGVQKIESVTVGGTVATTGTFNVVVARRLAEFDVRVVNGADLQAWDALGAPQVFDTSCFWPVIIPDATSTGFVTLGFSVING